MMRRGLARPWWLLPPGHLSPRWWIAVGAALIWIDYVTGPDSAFPVLYVIPVSLAAWYSGRWPSVALALAMPLAHLIFQVVVWQPPNLATSVAATVFRAAVILVMALWFARLAEHERALYRHVQTLEGLLPICAFCKSIRTTAGDWEPLEAYISTRSAAQFSHGFCPPCGREHYSNLGLDHAQH